MSTKKASKKMEKKDHSGMKKAAQFVRGGVVVVGVVLSVIPGLKGLSNLIKKS